MGNENVTLIILKAVTQAQKLQRIQVVVLALFYRDFQGKFELMHV